MADRSIRRLLLGWLLLPLAVVLATNGVAAYLTALDLATDAYDRALLDPALAISQRLRMADERIELDMPPAALDALRVDAVDRVFFSVNAQGYRVAGFMQLPPPHDLPDEGVPLFYDARVDGMPVRVAAMTVMVEREPVLVTVAETLLKRDRVVRQVLLSNVLSALAFVAIALAVAWFGVARGLAPLEALRTELAARSHRDLRPVPEGRAPEEVRPLVRELNQLLARIAETIDAQQRFVADAAHQLRTPLAALQAQVEAARRQPIPPEVQPTFDQLLAATRRTAHLARQLLTLAAVDPATERPFEPERVDLAEVLKPTVSEWVTRADARRIDLGFELAPAPVRGEPLLIHELAANLVDNALRYSPEGGEVTVRSGDRAGRAFLEVEDNGPGIPEAERERVFERFHRIRGTPGQGTGLGLAIVREIAVRHGAEVRIGVPASGRGTRFEVVFANG